MKKDNLEIILEDIRGKFDLVLEGHDALHKEIKDTRKELCEKINLVDFKVGALDQKIDNVETSLNAKIDSVENSLNTKIDSVETRLNSKIDSVETRLNSKIDSVETRLSAKIDNVAVNLAAHRRDTEAHPALYKVKEGN
jgi:SMC interacting uncharacterized protein involved in chromosome segregation